MHVFLATTKKSYLGKDRHIEANAQALDALKHSLSKEYLCNSVEHFDLSRATNAKHCGGGI